MSIDVTDQTFTAQVVEASMQELVVADFWAGWCGPCRALGPVLESLEQAMPFRLAKIDADSNPELVQQYGIRSLPTVKLFSNGEMVDEFVGALPETQIRQLIEKHLPRKSPADELLAEARKLANGNPEAAIELLTRAMELEPGNTDLAITLAELHAVEKNIAAARDILAELPANVATSDAAAGVNARVNLEEFFLDARDDVKEFAEAAEYYRAADYDRALQSLFTIAQAGPTEQLQTAARSAMLDLFRLPATDEQTVSQWRRRLATLLN